MTRPPIYVGRIVGVGRTANGDPALAYRVSSRSFPNRIAKRIGNSIRILPRAGSADTSSKSPYIAYECLLWNERYAVVSNGNHTRPTFERLNAGLVPRDALLGVLSGLDREFDSLDTPRICGIYDIEHGVFWLGSVTTDAIAVIPVEVGAGQFSYITTYTFPLPAPPQTDTAFVATSAEEICRHVIYSPLFRTFEKPICATAIVAHRIAPDVATFNRGDL